MSQQLNTIRELAFIDQIDGNFPYHDSKACAGLIDEALSISPNAVFAVVEEICRIPDEDREVVPFLHLTGLLRIIDQKFEHPLKKVVLMVARRMLELEETPGPEAAANIDSLVNFPRQFAALNIFYYSSFDDSGILDKAWDRVIKAWDDNTG